MSQSDIKILLNGPLPPYVDAEAAATYRVVDLRRCEDPLRALESQGKGVRGMITTGAMQKIGGDLFDLLPDVEIVTQFGVGYDNIDVAEARRRGIEVTHTPDIQTDEVADFAIGLLISTLRMIPQAELYLRAGKWRGGSFPATTSLRDRRVGVLGLGRIGRAVVRRLAAFGVPVEYHSRRRDPASGLVYHSTPVELARAVDTLIVTAAGGRDSHHLVDMDVLDALGPRGVVINVARGSVIDQEALISALSERRILTAGLDVYANEPEVPAELIAMKHVVLLPHMAAKTHTTMHAMASLIFENLESWFAGKGARTPVP